MHKQNHSAIATLSLSLIFLLATPFFVLGEESITLTTYYPSPYGSYRELRAQRMAIGDNYINGGTYSWDTGTIDANADLVVEGNVGIGTTTPGAAKLAIQNSGANGLIIHDTAQSGNYDIMTINSNQDENPAMAFLVMNSDIDGVSDREFSFASDGRGISDGGWMSPADYAEYFYSEDITLKPGELVSIAAENKVKRCEKGEVLIGIVSTKPGIVGIYADDVTDAAEEYERNPHYVKVALLGQVPVNVSVVNGVIKAGDQLTAGDKGAAVKGESPKSLFILALEDASEDGTIRVLVK